MLRTLASCLVILLMLVGTPAASVAADGEELGAVLARMEERFRIRILYAHQLVVDAQGQPITLAIESHRFDFTELRAIIAASTGYHIVPIRDKIYALEAPLAATRAQLDHIIEHMHDLEDQLEATHAEIRTLTEEVDRLRHHRHLDDGALHEHHARHHHDP